MCTPLTEYSSRYPNTMLCKSHTSCGLSCTDVGEIKCLSYQKRTPREKSPEYHTKDGASICCVTHSKQAPCVSANSGFIPTSRKFAYSNDSLTLQKRKKINKIKNPKHTSSHCIDEPQKAGGSGYLWHAKAVVLCKTSHRPGWNLPLQVHTDKHSRLKHVAIPVQKGL